MTTIFARWCVRVRSDGSLSFAWVLDGQDAAGWVHRGGLRRLIRKTAPDDWHRDPRKRNSTPTRRAIWRELVAS